MTLFRVLIASLATAAFYCCGREMGLGYTDRCRELREIGSALRALETEIVYGRSLLPEICGRLAARGMGMGSELFRLVGEGLAARNSAAESWAGAIVAIGRRSALNADDLAALAAVGGTLGQTDPADQSAHLTLARKALDERLELATADAARNSQLWSYLGLLGGLGLVLLVF